MNARAIQPLTAAGVAAVLTAATITAAGMHSTEINAGLRTEFAAVQLQALAVSAAPAASEAPAAAVTPAAVANAVANAAANAVAATDPVQMVTDVVRNVLSIAAAALWYAAFPITLPLSVIGGLVMNVAQGIKGTQASAAADPLLGITFFFTAPNVLLTTGLANFGLATNVIQQQQIHVPIGMAAAVRPAAAKRASTVPAAPAASARSAKSVAAAGKSGPEAGKRAAAARSRAHAR